MRPLVRHHHFKRDQIDPADRVSRLEAVVVDLLLESSVPDDARDSSIAWELKHQASVTQFARLLAARRGLAVDIGAVGALLHDIYVIETGSYQDHAHRGGPIAQALMSDVGGFSTADVDLVTQVVTNHSEKDVWTDSPYVEFGKDVDILDCFLYPGALDEYLMAKPLLKVSHYLRRAQLVWDELQLPWQPGFKLLDEFNESSWLSRRTTASIASAGAMVHRSMNTTQPPFALQYATSDTLTVLSTSSFSEPELASPTTENEDRALPDFSSDELLVVWPALAKYEIIPMSIADSKAIEICS